MKPMKYILLFVMIMLGSALTGYAAKSDKSEDQTKKQTTCPVMGGKINKAQYADVQGKRIYVCCPGCIAKIKAAPDKYIKILESKGVVLDKAPKNDGSGSKKTSHSHGVQHH